MHGGMGAERSTDRRRRKVARLEALEAGSDEALLAALPTPGTLVDGLVLESVLGQGGYGTVYLAWRDGRPYAVKFIYLPQAAEWALRELGAMVRMEESGGVGLRGHGLWPPEQPRFQFIVMDFVPGWELYTWARHHNPNALEVVDVLLDLAQELAAAHSMKVIHRDVKGDNVLVRETDGRALLVDFGVATYPGAPRITGPQVPGCREYLCPEVVRFNRGEREHHEASGLDDLWSVGVVAYKLLTATYPFQGRNAVETERAILHEAPEPPHERNPRVPRALSELCLRLLEKEPGARYPDAPTLHAALREVKRGADETWKVALCEAWGPDAATTWRKEALSTEEQVARLNRLMEYERRHPRRGEPWPKAEKHVPRPPSDEAAPPASETHPEVAASHEPSTHPAPALEHARPTPWWPKTIPPRAVFVAGLVLLVGMLTWLMAPDTSPVGLPRVALLPEFYPITLEVGGQEVAPPWKRPEGGGDAAPSGAANPAPVASATLPKDSKRVKTARNAPPPRDEKQQAPAKGSTAAKAGVAAVCTLLSGCPGAQVRPPPEPVDCPAEAVKTMEELGVYSRTGSYKTEIGVALTAPSLGESIITIRGGPVSATALDTTGKLPVNSTLSGQLIVGKERVYGRFTEAVTPRGDKFPVCFQFMDLRKPGALIVEAGPGPDLARISSGQWVAPVTRFE
ncbi:serine/threonine-protein kinase [Vitiosangium sp. GDMCC 1.1324]|uniref:serine/threonine protein kinase n=1 Tax=Vitiosangium sp. (strain GDMCC 1.1324) TaxID=2138576 RepID=UPI000D3C89D4|nr:serine/threonine-protein kinase [Vitiosangium sp. GDMCC 1.1324]PTL82042.1 hypothetical protein DAT35_19740 [Vitiosangium sp. GDMCC 1.1324]